MLKSFHPGRTWRAMWRQQFMLILLMVACLGFNSLKTWSRVAANGCFWIPRHHCLRNWNLGQAVFVIGSFLSQSIHSETVMLTSRVMSPNMPRLEDSKPRFVWIVAVVHITRPMTSAHFTVQRLHFQISFGKWPASFTVCSMIISWPLSSRLWTLQRKACDVVEC